MADCSNNIDLLKLAREGTSQDGRALEALSPAFAPVDERTPAHHMVFAKSYAELIKYFQANNTESGNWSEFFGRDISVLLAIPAIEDVDAYQRTLQEWFAFLNRSENNLRIDELREHLGYLFAAVGSLTLALDHLVQQLTADSPFRAEVKNLAQTQLAAALRRLIAYHKAGMARSLVGSQAPGIRVLGQPATSFEKMLDRGLSEHWHDQPNWETHVASIAPDDSVYGPPPGTAFAQINHCSTHTLFKSIFDQFLKALARLTSVAKFALEESLTKYNSHEPHYALFLTFLRLLEHARESANGLTQRHLDFYYRAILGLKEKSAVPGQVHLLAELAKQAKSRLIPAGALFKAGKDDQGHDAFFANDRDFVANQAKVAALTTVYRHGSEPVDGSPRHEGRIFAASVANSEDGAGAELTSVDRSWHPFFNKFHVDGSLREIRMPRAEIGFAIASHYLLMAGGDRSITVKGTISGYTDATGDEWNADVICQLSTAKGWLHLAPVSFRVDGPDSFTLQIDIDGAAPAIVPYNVKLHGGRVVTDLPLLLIKLKHDETRPYLHSRLANVVIQEVTLTTKIRGLREMAATNDFGPVDTSKPFQPFGASPVEGSSLVIGSKEAFQKSLNSLSINLNWRSAPIFHKTPAPKVAADLLQAGKWVPANISPVDVTSNNYSLTSNLAISVRDKPVFERNEPLSTAARQGYVRLRLLQDFGQDAYQADLIKFLRKEDNAADPGSKSPVGPTAMSLTLDYEASTKLALNTSSGAAFSARSGQFFHLTPFGAAEQHPALDDGHAVSLFPQFLFRRDKQTLSAEAELYIGLSGLQPPQNLALLFQVADGTANPLVQKPIPHIAWSYMRDDRWVEFTPGQIQDNTNGLLSAGIVTLSIPREATNDNTALPSGLHWIRAAVAEKSDAVCRLQLVATQALQAVFQNRANSASFPAQVLPARTITKLATPDTVVKGFTQPFPSFGGRGAEETSEFHTRISERLRHKNRAINLWDFERLILEAFPDVYKVKCLNHTRYEPTDDGSGVYRELAPGHVTIIVIPNLRQQHHRDPLKPYASLNVLEEIRSFLSQRTSGFVNLHVKNPQFEEVRAKFSVRLIDGHDATYYTNLLKQSITSFLSPWAIAGRGTPSFGGKVHKSALINFVEEQPYVDYVSDFKLFHDIGGSLSAGDRNVVEGSRSISVLVSAPASRHEIAITPAAQDNPPFESCSCES